MEGLRRLRLTSIIKHPPHVNGAFSLFLLELSTGLHQPIVHLDRLGARGAGHRHWVREIRIKYVSEMAAGGGWVRREGWSEMK